MKLDWCRDIDYGSLPQWLALLVGAVVAGFTIFGILTARSAYVDDVRVREYAQARLVYAEVMARKNFKKEEASGGMMRGFNADAGPTVIHFADEKLGRVLEVSPSNRGKDSLYVDANGKSSAQIIHVRIWNNSEELVSRVVVGLKVTTEQGETGFGTETHDSKILAPCGVLDIAFVVHEAVYGVDSVTVQFRDSSGIFWKRRGSEPVQQTGDSPDYDDLW